MPLNPAPGHIVRYPQSLSQRPGPSSVNRPKRPVKQQHPYVPESIDDTVPPIAPLSQVPLVQVPLTQGPMVPAHQYSSLADLLQKAGYKETRVYTPESEKRRIKRTLDEDDEINALYGSFGLLMNGNGQIHTRQEPSQPMKSSSSLLRRLALQDLAENSTPTKSPESRSPSDGWWGGGLAASLGRAAKAVVEPSTSNSATPPTIDLPAVGQVKSKTVRKVKSKRDLERGRRGMTEEPDQEQRPPVTLPLKGRALTESPKRNPVFDAPPPLPTRVEPEAPISPTMFDDDAFGFSPLPVDYEEQREDDIFNGGDPFQVGSLGTLSTASDATIYQDQMGESPRSMVFGAGGKGILVNAIEYDEDLDSPKKPNRSLSAADVEPMTHEEPEAATELSSRPRRYRNDAARLRAARSTPILKRQPSWMDIIRDTVLSHTGYGRVPAEEDEPAHQQRLPIKISPAVPAAPALVTASPIICDSTCAEAIDLPAIPSSMATAAPPPRESIPLRLRSSLAALRSAVGMPEREVPDSDAAPVLTPRLDWRSQGSQFAGWEKDKNTPSSPSARQTPTKRVTSGSTIDYSKSFFYKPATPPHPNRSTTEDDTTNAAVTPRHEPTLGKRRSIKSLRAALQIPVAPVPPVPRLPAAYRSDACPSTPKGQPGLPLEPPVLAILSPGAWEAGLPPRELVLEGEEWDARDGGAPGDWGRRKVKSKKKLRRRRSILSESSDT